MNTQRARLASSHIALLFAAAAVVGTLTACGGGGGDTTDDAPAAPSPGVGATPSPGPAPGTTPPPPPPPSPGPTPPSAPAVPAITSQPAVRTAAAGASATFEVTGTGSPSPTYQWEVSSDYGATFTSIAGATGRTYSTPEMQLADSGKQFRVVLANTLGSVISQPATLVVGVSAVAGAKVLYGTTQFRRPGGDGSDPLRGSLITFSVDDATGAVSPVVGRNITTGWSPGPIQFTPDGRFGYVRNAQDDSISAYRFDASDRIPVPVTGSPFSVGLFQILGSVPPKVYIHPNGRLLYVIATPVQGSNVVQGYEINPSTGALTKLAAVPATPGLSHWATIHFTASGACAVVNNRNGLYPLAVDPTTGNLRSLSSTPISGGADDMIVGAGGRFIYGFSNGLSGWSVSTNCDLTPIAGSPWTWISTLSVVSDPTGRHLYCLGAREVYALEADPATGSLASVSGSPFSFGTPGAGIPRLVYAPNTSRVYMVSLGQVSGFARDTSTGALQALRGTTFTSPNLEALTTLNTSAIDPDERALYSTNLYGQIWALRIDQQGGVSPVGSAPVFGIDALPIDYLVAR